MRLMNAYLIAYFVLISGAVFALWYSGALRQMPAIWVLLALTAAVGLGLLLAISARRQETTRE